ncbi:hypothetical protein ACFQL0_17150 [Haloplanus litoreus]
MVPSAHASVFLRWLVLRLVFVVVATAAVLVGSSYRAIVCE